MFTKFIESCKSLNLIFYIMFLLFLIFVFKNPDISIMIFAAMVFSCSLNPFVDKLSAKMPRAVASTVVLSGSLLILGILLIPLLLSCIYDVASFAVDFPQYVGNISSIATKYPWLHNFGLDKMNWTSAINSVAVVSADAINNAVEFFKSLSSIFLYLFLTVMFTFYFMADKDRIKDSTLKLFPSKFREKTSNIIDTISQRLGGYIVAQCCAIASIGVIVLIGLLIFRVPYAPLLALITAVLDIIPVVGPAVALVICLISSYPAGIGAIVVVLVTFCVALLIENNIVRPYAFGKLLNIHPMLIFIFLFLATKYLGIAGTLFAPAIAAAVCVLVDELYIKNLE